MALYIDEEEAWKCPKHPSKRRRTGICHVCLRDRLSSLCPDCAHVRPCGCSAAATTSSSPTFSRFSTDAGIGTVGRVSNLIETEPSFRRSRSLAIPFLRSKPAVDHEYSVGKDSSKSGSSLWSRLKSGSGSKSKRGDVERNSSKRGDVEKNGAVLEQEDLKKKGEEERKMMMRKSRSVAVTSYPGDGKSTKGKGWYFPSPIKAFKQSISRAIMVQERSPLYRG